jgi:hypothetical protein
MKLFFHRIYEMADLVATTIENVGAFEGGFFDELDWTSPSVRECVNRFSKTSLLAHCCFIIIRQYHLRAYRKEPEVFDEDHLQLTEEALQRYDIPFVPFREFTSRRFPPKGVEAVDLNSSVGIEAHNEKELIAALTAAHESGRKL